MDDYCNGIAYASGYFACENGKQYLVVRNMDKWYAEMIGRETGYRAYRLKYRSKYRSKYSSQYSSENGDIYQWVVKVRNISCLPELSEIRNVSDFCRAYIEIHGLLDLASIKDKRGNRFKRLRIYGKKEIISFLNDCLPAKEKKIQYVTNTVDAVYTGKTCILYYQSAKEIYNILSWIDGHPRNKAVWEKWENVIRMSKFAEKPLG